MMQKEEAIKIIEVAKAEVEWEAPLDYQIAFDLAIEALRQPTQQWIPVSERLPEPGQWVIATYERTYSDTGVTRRLVVDTIYSARKGWDDTPGIRRTVAWMPMPEPYAPTQSNDSKALDALDSN